MENNFKRLLEINLEEGLGDGLAELEKAFQKYLKLKAKDKDTNYNLTGNSVVVLLRGSLKSSSLSKQEINDFADGFRSTDIKP